MKSESEPKESKSVRATRYYYLVKMPDEGNIGGSRIRVFKNRILGQIFGPKKDENGEWRRLHNEEFHRWYLSPKSVKVITSRRLNRVGHVARIAEVRSAFKISAGKTVERLRCRWEDNIRMDLKELVANTRNLIS